MSSRKSKTSIKTFEEKKKINDFVLSGGVASNLYIRDKFKQLCEEEKIKFYVPHAHLCVDNATMIAWAGIEMLTKGERISKINLSPQPRWRIDKL